MFLRTACLLIYMFRSSVCNVHALCKVSIYNVCHNSDIVVGPDSRKVPLQQMDSDMCSKYQDMMYDVHKRQLSRSQLHLSKTKTTDTTDKSSIPFNGRQC